jgi:pyrophosphatase PpaX
MAQNRYDIALFDFDGTLADTLPLIYCAFNDALTPESGRVYTPDEIRSLFGPPDHQIIRNELAGVNADEAIARYNATYSSAHDELVTAYPGILELLAECRTAGIRTGVITGKSRSTAIVSLERLCLIDFAEILYGGDDVPRQKPDPLALTLALEHLRKDGATGAAMMIGDSAADVIAGRGAGCATIGVLWGSPDHADLMAAKPDYVVATVSELAEILLSR